MGASENQFVTDISETISSNSDITIFPIPAISEITIELNNIFEKENRYELCDISGKIILFGHTIEGKSRISINLANIPSGFYLFRIYTGQGIICKKIIKQ